MKIPKPFSMMRRVIRANQKTYIVTRPTNTVDDLGDITSTKSTHDASFWIQRQFEFNEMTDFGEVLEGDLFGIALPDTDVLEGDKITHGGRDYEVETIVGHPSDEDKQYVIIVFTYMRN